MQFANRFEYMVPYSLQRPTLSTEPTYLVSRDIESPTISPPHLPPPEKKSQFGDGKKNFGANVPTSSL